MKRIVSSLLFFFAAFAVAAAQGSVTVKVQNLVSVDEQFNVTFVIEGDNAPSEFSWSEGDDFQLVWGPQRGSSTSISIVNGKRTKSSQTTYTYILMPKRTGKFTLNPGVATIKGNQVSSKRAVVEVVSNGQSSSSSQSSSQSDNAASTGTVSGEDLFLRLTLSKTNVMVGETVSATLKLYQRVNIAGFEDAKFPTFNGFWSQEVQAPTNIEFHRENVGDLIYNAAVLRSWNLVAQQSGDIKIDPAELVCLVNIRSRNSGTGSIFDSFFQDDYQTIRKRVSTKPVTIHVAGLPAGAPSSFYGGVGKYSMEVSLTRDSLKAHDAASLKVAVTGTGNTTLLEAPKLNFPPDFEVYDVKVSDISGGKLFEYPFIPRSSGDFVIDPVKYSYFDISSRKYITLESKPLHISVARNGEQQASSGAGTLVQGPVRSDVKDLGKDIRFVSKSLPSLVPLGSFFVLSAGFFIILAVLILVCVLFFFVYRKYQADRADVAGTRNRSANKMARKRLAKAGAYLSDNLYTAFYEELHRALLGYVSDKLTMDASDMSKENISARLVEGGVPEAVAQDFVKLLDACEFARYAPAEGNKAMSEHYETAVSVISHIDSCMKKRNKNSMAASAVALVLALGLGSNALAAENAQVDSLWNSAVASYTEGEWEQAFNAWNAINAMGLESPQLYYNMGNAEYKMGNVASAILYYERSLKLDPSDSNVEFNLTLARSQAKDKIEEIPEFFLKSFFRNIGWKLSSNVWAVVFILLFAVTLALLLVFLLSASTAARKTSFICGIVSCVLSLLCLFFSIWQRQDYFRADDAVVMSAVCSVKSAPGSGNSQDLFILHEGTKVKVLDEVGDWRNIELADGRQGWLKETDIEII
ncbi:MAG: BatD family protein [Bacteroidales bacterium]|nr:BatD family protein [Candidatus Cryptobacteroides equifaecalis]